ncbi:17181_t:CDS:1, partial [Gigaspora margarita]
MAVTNSTFKWFEEAINQSQINFINYDEFYNFRIISKGGFGSVFKVEWKDTEMIIALKKIDIDYDKNARRFIKE